MANQEDLRGIPRGNRTIKVARSYGEREIISGNLPKIELVDGISPFGSPRGWEEREIGILSSDEGRRARETYWSPDLAPARDAVGERFGLDERSHVVFNSGTGVDGLLRTSLILIPKNPKNPPRAAEVGPHYPGYLTQLQIIGGLLPFPYSPNINLSADEALENVIEQHEKRPIKLASIYFARADFKGDIASRNASLKFVNHFTSKGTIVEADEVGLDVADDEESLAKETMTNGRLRVYRDASKTLGLPGLGFGIAIMHNSIGPNFERAMGDRYIRGQSGLLINALWQNGIVLPHLLDVRPKIAHAKGILTQELDRYGIDILPTDPRTPTLVVRGKEAGLAGITSQLGLILASGGGYDKTSEPPLSTEHVRVVVSKDDSTNREVARRISLSEQITVERKTPDPRSYQIPDTE